MQWECWMKLLATIFLHNLYVFFNATQMHAVAFSYDQSDTKLIRVEVRNWHLWQWRFTFRILRRIHGGPPEATLTGWEDSRGYHEGDHCVISCVTSPECFRTDQFQTLVLENLNYAMCLLMLRSSFLRTDNSVYVNLIHPLHERQLENWLVP